MREKFFGVLQRVGRSFMLPIAILPVAGLLLGLGSSFTNETTLATYNLLGVMGPGTVPYFIFSVLSKCGGVVFDNLPLIFALVGGNKFFCNHLCGRGQLFQKLGGELKCSRNKPSPRWFSAKWFRYGFLVFFLVMFGNMVFQTYLVAAGAESLREAIKLFWTFRIPWGWTYTAGTVSPWIAQFSFGFYSLMLTSLLIGLIVMVLYRPRSWCTFCPMGTMTQSICKIKNH